MADNLFRTARRSARRFFDTPQMKGVLLMDEEQVRAIVRDEIAKLLHPLLEEGFKILADSMTGVFPIGSITGGLEDIL